MNLIVAFYVAGFLAALGASVAAKIPLRMALLSWIGFGFVMTRMINVAALQARDELISRNWRAFGADAPQKICGGFAASEDSQPNRLSPGN